MAYEKTIWKNREVERPRTYILQDNGDGTHTLVPAEGAIIEPGTPITAQNMNNIEDGIEVLDQELASHLAENTTQGNPHGIDAKANKAQEAWVTPTLLNGWMNLSAPYAQVGYYKDEFGVVHLKGFVRSGVENTIFILPSGYRPSETIYFPVIADDTTPSFVQIKSNGEVSKPSGLTVTKWLNLTGIAFRAGV